MQKKYDFRLVEKEMQNFWKENSIYSFDPESHSEIYSIDTPPPTVSGSLHIGHIFSYTQAEMIARFKRMQGYNVFYPFGFDDNGLPTERLVEKEEGIIAKDFQRNEFIKKCIATTAKYEKEFKDLWQSLGFSVDWSLQYETINPMVQRISQKSFIKLLQDGKAYMMESPVLWCTECQTSIAQADLESIEKETTFNYVKFKTSGEDLVVATTRPELLYGCVCLFVNPEDDRFGQYIGKSATVPLYNYEIPILADSKVDISKGTGVVMCATFGDSTDAEWYKSHKLPYRKVILPDGTIDKSVPLIGGLEVKRARKEIIRLLEENGLLAETKSITHTVSVHERCGKEIEIIPSKQWYIDILTNKELFLKAADEINWYPKSMKSRYISWVENLKWDWCISRQRYFGVPFPIWYCKSCGKVIIAREDMLPVNPLETKPDGPCSCGCDEFLPESSVLDTWATSSITPQINAKWGEEKDISDRLLPMSLRTQAHEIIRTWAFYTIVKSLYHTGQIPWKDIMVCGFVLAKKGEKISKSKGNSELSPKELIENHSADVIRYWAANSKLGTDTFFSVDDLRIAKRFITKLWNASRFALSHLQDIDINADIELMPVDRWIIERCKQTIVEARSLLEQYEIGSARHKIDEFFWKDLCDYYLEIVKERLYQPEKRGVRERQSAQHALYYCMLNVLKLYAIYVPHITEYIYQSFFRQYEKSISLHRLCWETEEIADHEILVFGEKLKGIVSETRKYKTENALPMNAEMEKIVIATDEKLMELFQQTIDDIKACCHAKIVEISS
ncbi:valine--tRNA ligase [Clostridium thermosuccinogenes]|uniref:Valine--tRNA ligase n=1 Tax=Clostridium thermosuccinogenes TaxID=84032 RepID=A0A2K2FKX7_9CLOT|nr:valine--tRNA ligase [Pseudoclostridium thermosuccinogenes]AUS96043.1 valine--tRNA ligase [Pseudoclostridium thermosuccinogenes]PNT99431.1 valine--tRNA ligase [Pseudoclostridium thermosuccinogenes]PNU01118.1 valine--tRNA ligase [Pseudoclostridium thermosuccinogenes]